MCGWTDENSADRPEDWTEELLAELEERFYDLQAEVKQMEKHVKETQKMKDEADEAQWELDNQLRAQYDEVDWEWSGIIERLFDAKAVYETERLYNDAGPEDMH